MPTWCSRCGRNPQAGDEGYSGESNSGNGTRQFRSEIEDAYEELASREAAPLDDDDLRHLTISAKSDLQVIADELWLRGEFPPESGGPATLGSSQRSGGSPPPEAA